MPCVGHLRRSPVQVSVQGTTYSGEFVPGLGIQPASLKPSVRHAMLNEVNRREF